jgi:mevalonate kinase
MKKDLEKYLQEAIENIHEDRKVTKDLLKDVLRFLATDEKSHEKVGQVAAKYVETLQRSNEQLVKIIALLQKRESKSENLTSEDKQELFDLIQGNGTDA